MANVASCCLQMCKQSDENDRGEMQFDGWFYSEEVAVGEIMK